MKYLLIIIALGFLSCQDDVERSLNNTERKYVDSLVINHQKVWRQHYDSMCTINRDSMVKYYFDSLLRLEIESLKKLER